MAGFKTGSATLLINDDLIYNSSNLEEVTITINTAARDTGHPEASTHLRRGLLLGKVTADDKFIEYDSAAVDGSEAEENAVILGHEVRDMDTGDKIAMAYWAGTFKSAGVYVTGTAPTWNDVQRLRRR